MVSDPGEKLPSTEIGFDPYLLVRVRKGLLGLLSKVKIENCDDDSKEDLKAVYEFLLHLEKLKK